MYLCVSFWSGWPSIHMFVCVCVYDFDILKVHSTDFTHACQLNLHRVYIHLDSEEVLS